MEDIKVYVVPYPDRKNLVMRYNCPETGKQVARSTGTIKKREAERRAAKWEAALREGRYVKASAMGWDDFRFYFDENRLAAKIGRAHV